ncbi:hypothetical protein [Paenarthrobacter sp. JL.01a]|uniref:hypothetical protein n=1 Tax=Paenarthrobacter sp. JL.01a TaxID=2979324 RepID=UPI0021C5F7AA|nr:hypothetical protein [Paenarthrobacter sp. JL.01a]UXM92565.1 hypothetical protein N5P29_04345 [Paenarthrobacter sp. JL.01a]
MDLAEWFAGKRWVALLELIDMLPAACRLNEAIANDPEAAKAIAEASQGRASDPWAPRTSEWDLNATLLSEISNGIKVLTAATIKANGGKPGDVKPFPTPQTKIQAAMKAAEREWAVQFAGQFGFSAEDL